MNFAKASWRGKTTSAANTVAMSKDCAQLNPMGRLYYIGRYNREPFADDDADMQRVSYLREYLQIALPEGAAQMESFLEFRRHIRGLRDELVSTVRKIVPDGLNELPQASTAYIINDGRILALWMPGFREAM